MTTATRTRKQPTEAQQAAADERRAKIRQLAKAVSAMTPAERERLAMSLGGITTIEGRRLSIFNSCLVLSQRPATIVGGFQQWRRAGRIVHKGEHGIAIWIPTGTEAEPDHEDERQRFILGTVFDITQTDEIKEGE